MNSKRTSVFASAGLLLAACIWGFAFVVVKDNLDYIGAIYMIAFRFSIAAAGLFFISLKKLPLLNKRYLFNGLISGAFLFCAYAFQTIGCNYTTAGKNAFLTPIYVILIPLICWPLYKKRPGWYVFVAAILSLAGIALLALGDDFASLLKINIGDVLTLICGLFYALHIIWTERCNRNGEDTMLLTFLQMLFAACISWIAAPAMNGSFPSQGLLNSRVIGGILYLGLLSTLFCYILQNLALKHVPSSLASLFLSFESVFGVLFSTILLHEAFTMRMALGCLLIFIAIILAECVRGRAVQL